MTLPARFVAVVSAIGAVAFVAPAAMATPPDAELVTVTDTSFAATWTTAAASDTTVCLDDRPCVRQEDATRFHYAEVQALEPGRRYSYSLMSAGVAQPPSGTNPGSFTTLVPPPGKHLFDFAIVSDTHLNEGCSGTAVTAPEPVGSVPPCFKSAPGDPPYAATMAQATVDELNARGIPLAVLNADNTSHAEYDQVVEFARVFGGFNGELHAARGAHDRAGQKADTARCGADSDCFRSLLFPNRPPGRIFYSFDFGGYHFVALDSAKAGDGSGDLTDAAQNAFLDRDLEQARSKGQKTFVFFHHPVTEYANTTSFPPVVFGIRPEQGRQEFLDRMARFPNVVGVLNSHTHRNYVSYAPATGVQLPYVENGATKEYPGGYSVIRLYEGGYMRNFHRLRCAFCRSWISTTRDEYFGLYPQYTLGSLSARNFTHVYGCPLPTPPPSPPTGNESSIGGDTFRAACGSGAAPPGGAPPGVPGATPGGDGTGEGSVGATPADRASGETATERASSRRCHIPRTVGVTRTGIEALRIGDRRATMTSRAGVPNKRGRRSLRYCVVGGGRVLVALSNRDRAMLVASVAPGHRARGVHRGSSLRAMRHAYPGARRVGTRYWETGRRTRLVFGVKGDRVRFVASVAPTLIGNRRLLTLYVRRVRL